MLVCAEAVIKKTRALHVMVGIALLHGLTTAESPCYLTGINNSNNCRLNSYLQTNMQALMIKQLQFSIKTLEFLGHSINCVAYSVTRHSDLSHFLGKCIL